MGIGSKKLDQGTDNDGDDHHRDKHLDEGEAAGVFRHEPNRCVLPRPVKSLL